ncbi:hypothetical protein [Parapedobacter tibetensis]|uniref:hypothetical protein n=1 Tax=Parapedobacter tibetensis TaxID=2972951 RepID=UPI00214D3B4C|nr:hypothetical protein [Parapedobacter tibetensis]
MKHIYLLFAILVLAACSKEEVHGPWNLKNGQEVEVLVSHRYGAIGDQLLLLPRNEPGSMHLSGFTEREPGYNYRVKARMVAPEVPAMDGPAYHLEFIGVVSEEKYEGNEPFEIALIQSHVPGGPVIMLRKQDGHYHFIPERLTLTHANEEVGSQLEEIWQHNNELLENYQTHGTPPVIKWRAIKATVTHDPENFGKSYLVSHIEFTE